MEATSYPPWYITTILGFLGTCSVVIAIIAIGAFITTVTTGKEKRGGK